jgi:hypothetical protein
VTTQNPAAAPVVKKKSPLPKIIGVIIVAVFIGALVKGSIQSVEAECSLCVEYNGQRQCRTGAGANQADARAAAQRAACAVMAGGMSETIQCQNVLPEELRCTG